MPDRHASKRRVIDLIVVGAPQQMYSIYMLSDSRLLKLSVLRLFRCIRSSFILSIALGRQHAIEREEVFFMSVLRKRQIEWNKNRPEREDCRA